MIAVGKKLVHKNTGRIEEVKGRWSCQDRSGDSIETFTLYWVDNTCLSEESLNEFYYFVEAEDV